MCSGMKFRDYLDFVGWYNHRIHAWQGSALHRERSQQTGRLLSRWGHRRRATVLACRAFGEPPILWVQRVEGGGGF